MGLCVKNPLKQFYNIFNRWQYPEFEYMNKIIKKILYIWYNRHETNKKYGNLLGP